MGQCVLREWVIWVLRGTGTASGRPGVSSEVHKGRVDYLSRQFVPELYSPNGESVLATAGTTSLLVELIGVAA